MMDNANKYKALAKNSLIYMVGSFGSKIISFVIVPYYTYVLSASEYGTADLLATTVNLLLPVVTLGMNEAVLRYTASGEEKTEVIVSNALVVVFFGFLLSGLACLLIGYFSVFNKKYLFLFFVLLGLSSFVQVFIQLLRGIGKSASFALNGVISTVAMALANIISLSFFHLGVTGYLGSMVVAQLFSLFHIVMSSRLWKFIDFRLLDVERLKGMLIYCVPLIPNALMWWVMSVSDKYVIAYFLGPSSNGIYNVAQKIPSVVNVIYSIFMQAWQVSAIQEGTGEASRSFYSGVFRYMFALLAIVSSFIAAIAFPLYAVVMNTSYVASWQPVAMLAVANFFSCLGMFYGTTYIVTKETKRAFISTVQSGFVNLIVTLMLVPLFGILGAAMATAISYALLALIRFRDTQNSIPLSYQKSKVAASLFILLIQSILSLLVPSAFVLCAGFCLFGMQLVIFRTELFSILNKIKFNKDKQSVM